MWSLSLPNTFLNPPSRSVSVKMRAFPLQFLPPQPIRLMGLNRPASPRIGLGQRERMRGGGTDRADFRPAICATSE